MRCLLPSFRCSSMDRTKTRRNGKRKESAGARYCASESAMLLRRTRSAVVRKNGRAEASARVPRRRSRRRRTVAEGRFDATSKPYLCYTLVGRCTRGVARRYLLAFATVTSVASSTASDPHNVPVLLRCEYVFSVCASSNRARTV
mgnify:CR=1 FL=1